MPSTRGPGQAPPSVAWRDISDVHWVIARTKTRSKKSSSDVTLSSSRATVLRREAAMPLEAVITAILPSQRRWPRQRLWRVSITVVRMSHQPKIVLITGASSGIGAATAKRFAREPGTEMVLVARRGDRLHELADSLGSPATYVALDLVNHDAPERIRAHISERHQRLDLLVNNAGAAWRGSFAESGYDNVRRHMQINFDAAVRLTDALLPMLRSSAPSAVVNIASTAGRVSRPRSGAYSASKFALIGWTDALNLEERPNGVHVGLVLPGFIATEGFPATELRERALTRWIVSSPEAVAEAIVQTGPGGRAERYVPRPYALAAAARALAPGLLRRVLSAGRASTLTTNTAAERQSRESSPPPK